MEDLFKYGELGPSGRQTVSISGKTKLIIALVLVIAVFAFLIYWFVFRKKPRYAEAKGPFVLGPLDMPGRPKPTGKWSPLIPADQLARVLSNNFTCSFFVYMDDANRERIPIGVTNDKYKFQYMLGIGNACAIMMDPVHQKK